MHHLFRLLASEFKFTRMNSLIHGLVVVQPTIFFLLMSAVLVHPTFDMVVARPDSAMGMSLVDAMNQVGSPIGFPYINPIVMDRGQQEGEPQMVIVTEEDGRTTAMQVFGLIDSNLVKNYRNRLTAAGLMLWNEELAGYAVTVHEKPWLPRDMPFALYYGLALLPAAAFIAGSFIGSVQTAGDCETDSILEYRLATTAPSLILLARLVRIGFWALVSTGLLTLAIGQNTGTWPDDLGYQLLILMPIAIIAGCVGIIAGLLLQRVLAAFVVALTSFLGTWLLGGAFGLPAGFGGIYESLSRISPITYAVELLFPVYYQAGPTSPIGSWIPLVMMTVIMVVVAWYIYRRRVTGGTS